ncbi:MAG: translation initiation factor IF-2 [Actinomycetota bacterium]
MSDKENEILENETGETPVSDEAMEGETVSDEASTDAEATEDGPVEKPVLEVNLGITVKDFAAKIDHPASELIKKLFALGEMVTITQSLSEEAINVLADEFGYEAHVVEAPELKVTRDRPKDRESDLTLRPPVVTIMGHVNHGKTLLLDAIRQTDVVSQEAGGITQHIGAYQIVHAGKKITFIDTPGHEAFTTMRARGAKVTDIAILVVAADDGVMPQTIEAINHAKAAEVPIIVAVNKVDKPEANPDKVKQQLTEYELVPEAWGGETVFVDVSAKAKTGIDALLEMILLVAEVQELKANEKAPAEGTIIEAELDKARGPVATLLVQRGSLKTGALVVAGTSYGRVRAMNDDKGSKLYKALPSQPVELLGLNSVPSAGDIAEVVSSEKDAKDIVGKRQTAEREREIARKHVTLDNLFEQIQEGEIKDLNIVIKADVQGSLEALKESLAKIEKTEVRPNIVHAGVGGITETDIMLAAASNAIVVGFNVRPTPKAKEMAAKEEVDLRFYNIIYRVIEDIEAARKGMLAPEISEVELGRARILDLFKVSKIGTVAGCMVEEGELKAGANVRVVRDGVVIHDGKLDSLKRFKDDAASVAQGLECGLHVENYNDVKVDDFIEAYAIVETPRT